jgi:hypothetical protein
MLIQFSRDYRGKLTNENYYTAGTIVDLDDGPAANIVAEGAAIVVEPLTEEQPVEEAPKPKRGRPKKTAEE